MQKYIRFPIKLIVLTMLLISLIVSSINPAITDISEMSPASQMMLQGQAAANNKVEQANSNNNNDTANDQQEEQQEEPSEQSTEVDESKAGTEVDEPKAGTEENTSNNIEPVEEGTDTSQYETVTDAEQGDVYFTTNLVQNMTVTTEQYELFIEHLKPELTVTETVITVNDRKLPPAKMTLPLTEGENSVSIVVTYTDENLKNIKASVEYNVTLNTKTVVIDTTANNVTVLEALYRFTASASLAGNNVPIKVTLNDEELRPLAGRAYAATLKEGTNTLTITADNEKKDFTIVFEQTNAQLRFETDLYDQKVAISAFSFKVNAFYKEQQHDFTVTLNDEPLNKATQFNVTLKHGTNVIALEANANGEQLIKKYYVLYSDPSVVEEKPVDVLAPTIKTDLKDGTKVKGLIKTINVWPTTAAGKRIRGKNVAVKVNGVGVPFVWDDAEKTSYKLSLQDGENNVEIRAWDEDGRSTKLTFIVHAQNMENDVIGQVTISVEASVLGIRYLIPPTKMDIRQGEKGSYILDQLLREKGFSYTNSGTLNSNFYLSRIKKSNLLQQLQIPDDLWALVEQSSTRADREGYDIHSLGEFDFANGSGWMYSINGDYPNYGFSDAYFLDGDIVRIRYTLHYGKDINGFGSTSGDSGSNWDKEW